MLTSTDNLLQVVIPSPKQPTEHPGVGEVNAMMYPLPAGGIDGAASTIMADARTDGRDHIKHLPDIHPNGTTICHIRSFGTDMPNSAQANKLWDVYGVIIAGQLLRFEWGFTDEIGQPEAEKLIAPVMASFSPS